MNVTRELYRHKHCAIPFFEIKDGGHVYCILSKFEAFLSQFAFENSEKRTKTVLATLIALNTRNL